MSLDPVSSGDPHVPAHNAEREAINQLLTDVANKISLPGGLATGDLLRWDGEKFVSTLSRFFEGTGSPQNVVAAPVGSSYRDLDASSGFVEWTKTSGADSNTGWTASGQPRNTGRRNLAGRISTPAGSIVHSAHVRRWGDVVDMYLDLTTPTAPRDEWNLFAELPGFSPGYARHGGLQDNREGAITGTLVESDGGIVLYKSVATKRDRMVGTWLTSDAWPTAAQLPPAL